MTVDALRRSLAIARRSGEAAWIDLRGLAIDRTDLHSGLLHALTAFRLGNDDGRKLPRLAVLDWSAVDGTAAEALALFAVLVRTLHDQGVEVTVCEPADGDVASAIESSGVRTTLTARCASVSWVPCLDCSPARRVVVPIPAAHFAGSLGKGEVRGFLGALEPALAGLGLARERAALLSDTISELVLNVLRHAAADHATAVVLFHRRRRPAVVEIGVADTGMGLTTNLLQHPRHAWLAPLADRGAAAAVFGAALTSRDAEAGGGGMTRIMRKVVAQFGATVMVRSGAAKVTLRRATGMLHGVVTKEGLPDDELVVEGHTFGWGTQTRLTVPVS